MYSIILCNTKSNHSTCHIFSHFIILYNILFNIFESVKLVSNCSYTLAVIRMHYWLSLISILRGYSFLLNRFLNCYLHNTYFFSFKSQQLNTQYTYCQQLTVYIFAISFSRFQSWTLTCSITFIPPKGESREKSKDFNRKQVYYPYKNCC